MIKKLKIENNLNIRLDKYLKSIYTSLTQSFIEKNIRKKNILINKMKTSSKYIVKQNDELKILNFHTEIYKNKIVFKKNLKVDQKLIDVFNKSILYENENFIILNKWSSIATQGGTKIKESIDQIIKHISSEYKLVHRLDKETSGLLIISKNLNYAKIFGNLFKSKLIDKTYIAYCEGIPKQKQSIVNLDLKNKFGKIEKTETYYKVLHTSNGISLILFKPKTGKTHQIRRVSKNLSTPIIGDNKYNYQSKFKEESLKLNACRLKFTILSQDFEFNSKLSKDFLIFSKKNKLKVPKNFIF